MIIGIDANAFLTSTPSGVEITTRDLIMAILRQDTANTYWLYSRAPIKADLPGSDRVKNIVVLGKRFWTQIYLSRALKNQPPDIFWSPSHTLPNNLPKKSVATIHDLAWYLLPQSYAWKSRFLSALAVRKAIKQTSKLIAVSQQTKKDLKRYLHVPGEQIEVVYHDLRTDFRSDEFDFSAVYPELDQYLLCVGRVELKKNIPNLLKAFAEFNLAHPKIKLVLVGGRGNGYASILGLIKKLHLGGALKLLNYVPDGHLPVLYRNSLGVVFPSLYEGFGMPILEGFASKIPVLTADVGATREIAGNAAILIDPNNISAIEFGLNQLVDDHDLRSRLINRGQARLKEFNWETSAQKVINLWKTL